jgi:hypothetical protein
VVFNYILVDRWNLENIAVKTLIFFVFGPFKCLHKAKIQTRSITTLPLFICSAHSNEIQCEDGKLTVQYISIITHLLARTIVFLFFFAAARTARGNNLIEGSNNIHSKRLQKEVPGLPLGKNPYVGSIVGK